MNKGISYYFGFKIKPEKRVKMIKEAGFDCVITSTNRKFYQLNGTLKKRVELFNKYGLKLSSLHMRYKTKQLPNFWLNNWKGKRLLHNLIKDVKTAHKYGFTSVVVHLKGQPSELGLERLRIVLKLCEELKVPLAIENLSQNKQCCEYVFKHIKSDYLKFCYDSGHANIHDIDFDYFKHFGNELITLHLHDNWGVNLTSKQLKELKKQNCNKDMHTLNKYGTIDWHMVAKNLAKYNLNIKLDYEVLMSYRKMRPHKKF